MKTFTKISHLSVKVDTIQMQEEGFRINDLSEFACRKLNLAIRKLEQEVGIKGSILKLDERVNSEAVTIKEHLTAYDAKQKYGKLPPQEDFMMNHYCELSAYIVFEIPESKSVSEV